VTFEEAGKAIDKEVAKLVEFIDKKVRPATRKDTANLLKKAADKLSKLAESLEKE
jgi:Holliday junction resolvase RusA-like endonuclease